MTQEKGIMTTIPGNTFLEPFVPWEEIRSLINRNMISVLFLWRPNLNKQATITNFAWKEGETKKKILNTYLYCL